MFANFFIRRPVFACVMSIFITLVGLFSLTRLPIVQYPEITPPVVRVSAVYPGASADIVEETVATPIEQKVNGSPGMIYMTSKSANDGSMNLDISFEVGTDLDLAAVDVQNRVAQAQSQLPQEVNRQGLTIKKRSPNMLLVIGLISPDGSRDDLFLSNYASINLVDAISRINGVGDVSIAGQGDYGLRIWLDPDKLANLGMTVQDVSSALKEQNLQAPAGQVGQPPVPKGQEFQYTVRVKGRLTEIEEFQQIILRANPDGSLVKLQDVASIELGAKSYGSFGRLNGKPAALVVVYQTPGANALKVADQIKGLMSAQSRQFPSGVDYTIPFDSTLFVKESIHEVIKTLYEAFLLVFLVTFLFLQNWRATLIPTLAVPVALIGTFAFFQFLGFSINTLTLFALVLSIGLLVDDAIVVVEAVEVGLEQGLSSLDATKKAMSEVSGPIIAITLALFAVFVPVAFMGGITGQLYQQFAITLCVSVALSALNSLSLSPALCAILLKPPAHGKRKRGPLTLLFGGFNWALGGSTHGYLWIVGRLLRKSVLALGILALFGLATGWLFKVLPTSFLPDEDQGYFFAQVQLPEAASQERNRQVVEQLEGQLLKLPGTETVLCMGGQSLVSNTFGSNVSGLIVILKPWKEREGPALHVKSILAQAQSIFAREKAAIAYGFLTPSIPGLGNVGGWQFQLQDRTGRPLAELGQKVQEFIGAARKDKVFGSVTTSLSISTPQVKLDLDRDKVKKLGIPLNTIFDTLQANMGGLYVNDINKFGRTYRVMIQAAPEYRRQPSDIGRFYVRSQLGEMVPLNTLAVPSPVSGPEFIVHHNLYRTAEVNGFAAPGYSSGQALQAAAQTAEKVLPAGWGYEWTGMSYQEVKAGKEAPLIMGMAVLFLFLVLAAQYESWSIPFSVVLAIPFGVFGALMAQKLRGFENNIYAQIGIVMLIGLAAKNAILIVEYALERRRRRLDVIEAAKQAARLRFRPILMTSFAFILGCLPLMLSTGAGAASRQAMGTAVVGGMLVATIIGIQVIPTFYLLFQKVSELGSRKKAPAGPPPEKPEPEPELTESASPN